MKVSTILFIAALIAGVGVVGSALVASQPKPEHDIISVGVVDVSSQSIQFVFENATNLTNNEQDSVYGQVAAWNNSVYVIWQDSVSGGNYDIFIKKSVDSGRTFGSHINLSNNSGFSEHPKLSVYGSNVYAVWADNSPGNREILFSRSIDNGTIFEAIQNLSNDSSDSYNQEIAAYGDNVHILWLDRNPDETSRILFRSSPDGGATFGETVEISKIATIGSFPKVAAYGDNDVYVTWNVIGSVDNDGLYFAKSSDGGRTFSEPVKLTGSPGESQVAAYNQTVYVISGGLYPIDITGFYLFKSTDSGETFAESLLTDPDGVFVNPTNVEIAALSEELVYVAGQVFVGGNQEILLLPVVANNAASVINLSENPKISECPSIAISGDNIYVVWEDMTPGNHEVLYAKGSRI
ncbi:MAG TPA: sialidase family protein [Nitrososphaera sp.]|nr:sialidase family protein [Nitrososphaera sp.]